MIFAETVEIYLAEEILSKGPIARSPLNSELCIDPGNIGYRAAIEMDIFVMHRGAAG